MATLLFPLIAININNYIVKNAKNILKTGKLYNNARIVKINKEIQPKIEVSTYLPPGPKLYKIQSIKKTYTPPNTIYIGGTANYIGAAFPVNTSPGEWNIKYDTILIGNIDTDIPNLHISSKSNIKWDDIKVNRSNRDMIIEELKLDNFKLTLPNKFNLKLYQPINDNFYMEYKDINNTKKICLSHSQDKLIDNLKLEYDEQCILISGVIGLCFDMYITSIL